MKLCVLLLTCGTALAQYYDKVIFRVPQFSISDWEPLSNSQSWQEPITGIEHEETELARGKRSAVGALHIITNHAQPIHADVKPESSMDITEKPCPKGSVPSHIEPGAVFQVTAPGDILYEQRSLRKSLPWEQPRNNVFALDLVRTFSRLITLAVLIVSAIFEFYPMMQQLITEIYTFLNMN